MDRIVISGTGLFTPAESISNQELVASFNAYARERGLEESSAEFIEKASGIKSRYVMDKRGVLDPAIMAPRLRARTNEEPSILCEMAVAAATQALAAAGIEGKDIDCVLVGCSNLERAYPAIAIEVQAQLGAAGYGYDLNVACSSATFAIQAAVGAIRSGSARRVLVVNPEICSGHLNFRDRDSHFIFGDACTAMVIEASASSGWEIVGIKLATTFSNNIRNNFGFLNRATPETANDIDKLFVQQGRKVFKEVCPMVAALISAHLDQLGVPATQLKRMWLHQANLAMNQLITKRVLGRDASEDEAPNILGEYANTSSAGSIIAFHKHQAGLAAGDLGPICSFGAGYSVGNVVVRKTAAA